MDDAVRVDLNKIADHLGVFLAPMPATHQHLSGAYIATPERTPTIYWNQQESTNRQRFSIAHSIGHHVLKHGRDLRDLAKNYGSEPDGLIEMEANRFAVELLVPRGSLRPLFDSGYTVDELSKVFGASQVAVYNQIRLVMRG